MQFTLLRYGRDYIKPSTEYMKSESAKKISKKEINIINVPKKQPSRERAKVKKQKKRRTHGIGKEKIIESHLKRLKKKKNHGNDPAMITLNQKVRKRSTALGGLKKFQNPLGPGCDDRGANFKRSF